MLIITPAEVADITKLSCPQCNEKVPRIGLHKDSQIKGLTFKCKKCGKLWEAKTK